MTTARQTGLTLIEVMIALTIGLLLTAGMIKIYVSSRDSYQTQEALARMQENGRFAIEFLSRDLRMAGNAGCNRHLTAVNNTLAATPTSFVPQLGIQGWEFAGTGPGGTYTLPGGDLAVVDNTTSRASSGVGTLEPFKALPGSDIVRVWGTDTASPIVNVAGNTITVNHLAKNIRDGDIVLASDCARIDIAQACGLPGPVPVALAWALPLPVPGCMPGTRVGGLWSVTSGTVAPLTSAIFYVGKRDGKAANPPALFRKSLNGVVAGAAEEVVEGIENLQVLYGVDLDGDSSADTYLTGATVVDWTQVVSARVAVLVRSEERVSGEPALLPTLLRTTIAFTPPYDGRLRRVFTATVQLRNRGG